MKEDLDPLNRSADQADEKLLDSMRGMFAAAQPSIVYGEPRQIGEKTIITASEVFSGGGFGFGRGVGTAPSRANGATQGPDANTGGGTGGGGGGGSSSRPVAVIIADANGVRVQPVVDVTKIVLTALTAWATVAATLVRMRRGARG